MPKLKARYYALAAKEQITFDIAELESSVYSHLFEFFNRYYDDGDFIPKRRYKEGVYAIPYEGEEVKLYWANHDQYYIKSSENFKEYSFKCPDGKTVRFHLAEATQEQNNNKEADDAKRVFMLYDGDAQTGLNTIEIKDNEMIIRFLFDVSPEKNKKQEKWTEENYEKIKNIITGAYLDWAAIVTRPDSTKEKAKSIIEKHLDAYVKKNTFDYFIHKDLRGFLNRELDFYIKNEIIRVDDIDADNESRIIPMQAKYYIKTIMNIQHGCV